MGNPALLQVLLMIPSCGIIVFNIAGAILGIIAFNKVRKLEKRLNQKSE